MRRAVCGALLLAATAGCAPSTESARAEPGTKRAKLRVAGATPEDTLERFINAHTAGDNDELSILIHPPHSRYRLKGPAPILQYKIQSRRELTAEDVATFESGPAREVGDVEMIVWEEYPGGRTSLNTYTLRGYPDGWKIYTLSYPL